ncbi:hypothetical protein JR316_0001388 [Psilocybe cubensis]|uniref:Uncharacterized protein n=1 Tax=Psilocybe cubensis TaxID=181762 RepID=A0ACB8HH13_PSICU|nr:hypothetical protein JR316_0001388 [Psilocybe cubensis]KAH9487315.1 hypothetical protein JR316_0001388 [Psilocybe cubensis]
MVLGVPSQTANQPHSIPWHIVATMDKEAGTEHVPQKVSTEPEGLDKLFPWLKPALRSRRTIKTWIRCCIALATTMMLMVATKPAHTMGQAAFFCVIVAVMLPPTFALSVFLMAATTLLVGMLLGWAWGSAAMASALSVRSASLFAQQSQTLKSLLDPTSPIPIARQIQIHTFHGIFLDPRVCQLIGGLRRLSIYWYICNGSVESVSSELDAAERLWVDRNGCGVYYRAAAVLPTAQYTIPEQLIIPTTFYVAVAIGTVILIFPESLSHVWLTLLLESFWTKTLDLLRLQSETLALRPSDHEAWTKLNARGTQLRTSLVAATDAVSDQLKLIDLDTSIGRLGPADLKKINLELKSIMFRAR